jgi:DNA-binding winged helix-turn-helix (wHTH) protein/tetratricopeptide (TPR) repeat protein
MGTDPTPASQALYRFGLFTLDPATGTLTRRGLRIKLQEQPFRFLVLMLEKQGTVVSRVAIRERLWPGNTFVDFDKSLGVAVLKVREALEDDASNPRFVETIPRQGYRFIAPVEVVASAVVQQPALEADSNQSRNVVPGFLNSETIAASKAVSVPPASLPVWHWVLGFVVAICMFGFSFFGLFRIQFGRGAASLTKPLTQTAPVVVRPRRSVAVLGFRSLPQMPQSGWLSIAFSEMLNTELAAGGRLRMISSEDVARVKREISLTPETTLSKSTLQHLRSNLGADVVVLGSYTLLPSNKSKRRIRLDVRMQDTALGETLREEAFTGDEDHLFDLASRAGVQLREELSPESGPTPAIEGLRASVPSNQLALQLYSEGRARLYAFDFIGARKFLQRATAADPDYPLAHSALSEAWSRLGYTAEAHAEAKQALNHSHALSPEEALLVRGQYQETMSDWDGAADTYQSLFATFPDSVDYGLRLASVQLRTDQAAALLTLAALRKLPSSNGGDPRIDLMEASAWVNRDLAKGRAAARRAVEKASAQGATLTVARGLGILCQLDASSSISMEQSVRECNTARATAVGAGDLNNAARTLNDLAANYYLRGDIPRAESSWREALAEFRAVGDAEGIGAACNNLGATLLTEGDLDGARSLLQESITNAESIGDKDGVSRSLADLGDISIQRGDLHAAQIFYQRSTAVASAINDTSAAAFGMAGMGDVLVEQADLAAAESFYNRAIQQRTEVGEKQAIEETNIQLARLAIEQGHAPDVTDGLRKIQQRSRLEHQEDDELTAGLMLTRALLAQSKAEDAKTEIAGLRTLADATQNRLLGLRFGYTLALVQSQTGDLRASRSGLMQVVTQAEAHGFGLFKQEVLIALAKLEMQSSRDPSSRARLAYLQKGTEKKGLFLLARNASPTY